MIIGLSGCGIINPKADSKAVISHELVKYDFDSLKARGGVASEIKVLDKIEGIEKRRNYNVGFVTREISFESDGKKVSGMLNYRPEKSSLSPVIIMIRGYADGINYYPGYGSWRVADQLAADGYATFSLDFLGYGNSDKMADDGLEARFHKVVEVLDLIESIKALPWVDKSKIGIWAHSNGGQIALSVLETTGARYPAVLWAPMTNAFPQSLIDTSDEGEDRQKTIDYVNLFLKKYDGRRYAFENYYSWVKAPVLILQGTKDDWCKVEWQQKVVADLQKNGKQAELKTFDGDDHNFSKDWNTAVEETKGWFRSSFRVR